MFVKNLELFTERERMKIKVIQGTIIESNLTYGKLKLLSISSEGLVIGKYKK